MDGVRLHHPEGPKVNSYSSWNLWNWCTRRRKTAEEQGRRCISVDSAMSGSDFGKVNYAGIRDVKVMVDCSPLRLLHHLSVMLVHILSTKRSFLCFVILMSGPVRLAESKSSVGHVNDKAVSQFFYLF